MKNLNILGFIFGSLTVSALITSCQTTNKEVTNPNLAKPLATEQYQAQIKSDKKKQAELDLPFRGFENDKVIKTIAFGSPETNCWQAIQKNNPELMILTSVPLKNLAKLPEYRSIREKVPFMCTPSETKSDFIKNWPYAKNVIPENQDGIYHSKIFGTKKNLIQVIMVDQFDSELKWNWLESEFKKPTALKILTSPTRDRDKLIALIKKSKTKNIILLSNDRPVTAFEKTEIKDLGPIYESTSADRSIASSVETTPVIFGVIRIDWSDREAQLEMRNVEDKKLQVVELKF